VAVSFDRILPAPVSPFSGSLLSRYLLQPRSVNPKYLTEDSASCRYTIAVDAPRLDDSASQHTFHNDLSTELCRAPCLRIRQINRSLASQNGSSRVKPRRVTRQFDALTFCYAELVQCCLRAEHNHVVVPHSYLVLRAARQSDQYRHNEDQQKNCFSLIAEAARSTSEPNPAAIAGASNLHMQHRNLRTGVVCYAPFLPLP
jgi:hypothetical protein